LSGILRAAEPFGEIKKSFSFFLASLQSQLNQFDQNTISAQTTMLCDRLDLPIDLSGSVTLRRTCFG